MRWLLLITLGTACSARPGASCHVQTQPGGSVLLACPGSAPLAVTAAAACTVPPGLPQILRCPDRPDVELPFPSCLVSTGGDGRTQLTCGGTTVPIVARPPGRIVGRVRLF